MTQVPLVLASGSPRRKELLENAGFAFTVVTSEADESIADGIPPQQAVQILAERKAEAVRRLPPCRDSVIVAADTVVSLDGRIFGKPASEKDAEQMLSALSGRTHQVFTGVCIWLPDSLSAEHRKRLFFERTDVTFYPLDEQTIRDYVATGEPMDKAGAYGIQGKGALLIRRIEGDYCNVVGLPIARLARELGAISR